MGWKDAPLVESTTTTPAWMSAPEINLSNQQEIPAWKRNLSAVARPSLELGGGLIGGVLGAGATSATLAGVPVGVAAGGALGIAGGKATADALDTYLGIKAPMTPGQALAETGEDLVYGVKAEALGQGFAKGAGMLARPLAKPVGKLAEKAKEIGLKLTPAELSKSKPWALVESVLEKVPFSSGIINRFRGEQAVVLEKAAKNLLDDLGSMEASDVVGQKALAAIKVKTQARLAVRDRLFDRLTDTVPKNAVVNTEGLKMTADKLLLAEQQLPRAAQQPGLSNFLEQMRIGNEGLSFQGAKNLRQRLNQLIGFVADTPEKFAYKQIKDALDDDISRFAVDAGGDIEKAWRKANAFHGSVKELGKRIDSIARVAEKEPEKIVKSVFKPESVTNIRLLRKAMPEKEFQNLREAFVSELFEGKGAGYQNIGTNLAKYGDETLNAALPPTTVKRLKEFADLTKNVKIAEKIGGNPSGTAQNVITWASIGGGGYMLSANPVGAAAMVITPPVMAKLYLSDMGRKLITEGMRIPAGSARAVGIATALTAMSKRYQNQTK